VALVRGHGAPEALAAFSRARELCDPSQPTVEHFQALMGIGASRLIAGECERTAEIGAEISRLCALSQQGERAGQTAPEVEAHLLMEPGVAARCFSGLTSWLLGESGAALAAGESALSLAAGRAEPHTECLARTWHSLLLALCGQLEESRRYAELGMEQSAKYGLVSCEQTTRLHWGAVCIGQGQLDQGIQVISDALAANEECGAELGASAWDWMLAEAYGALGQLERALLKLGHGFTRVRRKRERWWEPELYRSLGGVLARGSSLELPPACRAALEGLEISPRACVTRALELSRAMGARALEQRAGHSLRLLEAGPARA
jgi:hypothetical protein